MRSRWVLLMWGLLALPALAGEQATLVRADSLRAKPFVDAQAQAQLEPGTRVELLTRQGAWYQVKAGTRTGWVRMLNVKRAQPTGGAATTSELGQVASGRAGTGRITSTTGVRGLDEQTLREAPPDEAALRAVEAHRASPEQAQASARERGLEARQVGWLPEPEGAR